MAFGKSVERRFSSAWGPPACTATFPTSKPRKITGVCHGENVKLQAHFRRMRESDGSHQIHKFGQALPVDREQARQWEHGRRGARSIIVDSYVQRLPLGPCELA
jgi:hypothetical protein